MAALTFWDRTASKLVAEIVISLMLAILVCPALAHAAQLSAGTGAETAALTTQAAKKTVYVIPTWIRFSSCHD